MSLDLVHLGSKSRSLGQVKEIPCGPTNGSISLSIDLKICLDKALDEFESPGVIN